MPIAEDSNQLATPESYRVKVSDKVNDTVEKLRKEEDGEYEDVTMIKEKEHSNKLKD